MEARLGARRVRAGPAARQGDGRVDLAGALCAGHEVSRPQPSGRRGDLRARGRLHRGRASADERRLSLHAAQREACRLHRGRVSRDRHTAQARRNSLSLLDAVAGIRDVLVASATESERTTTLAPAAVAALEGAGLLALKLPKVLGGAEADPVTQIDVIEAVSAIDAA